MTQERGDRSVIEPSTRPSLLDLLKTLQPIEEDFAPISDPAPQPVDV